MASYAEQRHINCSQLLRLLKMNMISLSVWATSCHLVRICYVASVRRCPSCRRYKHSRQIALLHTNASPRIEKITRRKRRAIHTASMSTTDGQTCTVYAYVIQSSGVRRLRQKRRRPVDNSGFSIAFSLVRHPRHCLTKSTITQVTKWRLPRR